MLNNNISALQQQSVKKLLKNLFLALALASFEKSFAPPCIFIYEVRGD